MIIGLAGKIGSGKTFIADYLVEQHGFVSLAFADPLKRMVSELLMFPYEWTQTSEGKNQMLHTYNVTVRKAMQVFGTEVCQQIHRDVFINYLVQRINNLRPDQNVVVSDVRFMREAKRLLELDAKVVRLTRFTEQHLHGSEMELDMFDLRFSDNAGYSVLDNKDNTKTDTLHEIDLLLKSYK